MRFEWDRRKAERNLAKHRVDFEDAKLAFVGPLLEKEDRRRDYGETRWRALGEVGGVVLEIVFTRPAAGVVRLVSAWKAGRQQREVYRAFRSAHGAAGEERLEAPAAAERRRGRPRGRERS